MTSLGLTAEEIATAVRNARAVVRPGRVNAVERERMRARHETLDRVAGNLSAMLLRSNPGLDVARFLRDCGVKD